MRHAARKDNNKDAIVKALREAGAYVYDLKLPVDLLVGYKGRTLLIELKTASPLTPAQKRFIEDWTGGELWIVYTVEQALGVLYESACGL